MTTDTILQDKKKRTLDALERRFALADAELHLQKQKNKKRPHEEKGRANIYTLSSSKQQAEVLIPPSSNTSFKKGKFSVSGQTPARDVEANDPVYSQLLHAIDENLAATNIAASSKSGSIADWIFNELRQNGDSAQKYMQGSRNMKRDEWILLDNLVQGQGMSGAAQAKALRSFSKRSQKHMSVKQLKKCGSLDLPQELHNFEIFKPMHEMWKGYMKQLLKNVGKNEVAKYLLSADLHGAVILVAECKIAAFTGINGIMIRETAETFGIITQDKKFRGVACFGVLMHLWEQLCRKSFPSLSSKLIPGKLRCMETSSLREKLANDLVYPHRNMASTTRTNCSPATSSVNVFESTLPELQVLEREKLEGKSSFFLDFDDSFSWTGSKTFGSR